MDINMGKLEYQRGLELARAKKTRLIAQICDDIGPTGEWLVSSSTRGEGYVVDYQKCTCQGHYRNGWCRHRAWLLYRMHKTGKIVVFSTPNGAMHLLSEEKEAA